MNLILVLLFSAAKYVFQAYSINPFEIDQEFLSLQAWDIVKNHQLTLIGAPTSVGGIFIAPFYTYFVAIIMFLSRFNPFTITGLYAFWAVLTPMAIYLIGKKVFSSSAALLASALAIVSISFLNITAIPPLVAPLPLISLLAFYFLSTASLKAAAAAIGISLSLHFTGIYLALISFIYLKKKSLALPFLIILLFVSPLIWFEFRHQFFISKNFINFLSQKNSLNSSFFSSFLASFNLMLATFGELVNNFSKNINNILVGLIALLIIGLALVKRQIRHRRLILLFIFIPLIANSFYQGNLLPYYFAVSEPVFLLSLSAALISQVKNNKLAISVIGLLIIISALNNLSWHQTHPYAYKLQNKIAVFEAILSRADPRQVNLSITAEHARRGGSEFLRRYYGFSTGLNPSLPTYSVIIPSNYHNIVPDIKFGAIGLIYPQ